MSHSIQPASILFPRGFWGQGVFCDVKRLGTGKGSNKGKKRDLAVLFSPSPCVAAGMFTTNQVSAAPVHVCIEHLKGRSLHGIVVNSGNANACTGEQGFRDAKRMCQEVGKVLSIDEKKILVASTGRIGLPLPMPQVRRGIRAACSTLAQTREAGDHVSEAILTSDTHMKQYSAEIMIGGKPVRIGAAAKGAGMIHPGMSPDGKRPMSMPLHATMLGFILTDANISKSTLQRCLTQAVALSFNRISIDGDMSTNDSVIALANGEAGNKKLHHGSKSIASQTEIGQFQEALNEVCLELAKMLVRDGEGVSRFVTVRLEGARSSKDADLALRSVCNSALVKTSWLGGDPNWGRILDALGYSEAKVDPSKVHVGYRLRANSPVVYSLKNGKPTRVGFAKLCSLVAGPEIELHIHLNLGKGRGVMYASDLTEAYVSFNKGDVTDPASLGG